MGKQQSKLVAFPNKDKKLKVESRSILKKKAVKKKCTTVHFEIRIRQKP